MSKKPKKTLMKQLNINVPGDELAEFKEAAKDEDMPLSLWVRRALMRRVKREEHIRGILRLRKQTTRGETKNANHTKKPTRERKRA